MSLGRGKLWLQSIGCWILSTVVFMQAAVAAKIVLWGQPKSSGPLALSQVRRVLVVHLFEIGDVVMLTPFLRELRRLLPDASITLVVKPETQNLVEICPYLNEVISYNTQVAPAKRPFVLPVRAFVTASRQLQQQFDLALVPSWLADNSYASFLACFSGARWRIGYSEHISERRRRLNRGFDRLFTSTMLSAGAEHDVKQNLAVISYLGGAVSEEDLELWLDAEDTAFARSFLKNQGVRPGDALVAICPTAGHSRLKQWPLGHFVTLAQRLQSEMKARVLLVGGPGDVALGSAFEALEPALLNAVGKTTLRQMAALITHTSCFVGNDAGPMHIAVAVRIPTVALFGSSCHHRYGPWGQEHTIISHMLDCSPCGRGHAAERCVRCIFDEPRCLTGIRVEEVWTAVKGHLPDRVTSGAMTIE